jgi:imidazolonepropionase-like amidohydrolase
VFYQVKAEAIRSLPGRIEAIVSTAKDYGMQVAAHAHGDEGCNERLKQV